MSQTNFQIIWITKSKVILVQIPVPKWKKGKKWENFFGLQNRAIRGLQIGAGFWYHKSGLEGLQIETALEISNRAIKLQIGAERKYLPDVVIKFE